MHVGSYQHFKFSKKLHVKYSRLQNTKFSPKYKIAHFSKHAYVGDFPALHKTTQNLLRIHMQLRICTELLYLPLTTTILVADPTVGKGVGMSTSKPEWSRIIAFYANFICCTF